MMDLTPPRIAVACVFIAVILGIVALFLTWRFATWSLCWRRQKYVQMGTVPGVSTVCLDEYENTAITRQELAKLMFSDAYRGFVSNPSPKELPDNVWLSWVVRGVDLHDRAENLSMHRKWVQLKEKTVEALSLLIISISFGAACEFQGWNGGVLFFTNIALWLSLRCAIEHIKMHRIPSLQFSGIALEETPLVLEGTILVLIAILVSVKIVRHCTPDDLWAPLFALHGAITGDCSVSDVIYSHFKIFLHSDGRHLPMNILGILGFCSRAQIIGSKAFAIRLIDIAILAHTFETLLIWYVLQQPYRSVGFSGVLYGLDAMAWAGNWQKPNVQWTILFAVMTSLIPGVSFIGHLTGAFAGIVLLALRSDLDEDRNGHLHNCSP